MSACAACGIDNAPGARFCKRCGETMTVPCPTCNIENGKQAKYCRSCAGSLQSVGPAPVSNVPKPISVSASPVNLQATVKPVPTSSPVPTVVGGVTAKANGNQGSLANVLIVAILLIVGYFYLSNGKGEPEPAVPVLLPTPSEEAKSGKAGKQPFRDRAASNVEENSQDRRKTKTTVDPSHIVRSLGGEIAPSDRKEAIVLINRMLDPSVQSAASEIRELATRIAALPKAPRGDRKVARGLNYEAMTLLGDGRYAEAAVTLEKAAAADPADVEIADNLAFAALKGGNFDEAKRSSYAALAIAPGRSSAWASLGVILAQTETEEQAVAAFANAYRFSGNTQKTIEYLEKLVAEDSNDKVKAAAAKTLEILKTFH